jgi:hypothetical protein
MVLDIGAANRFHSDVNISMLCDSRQNHFNFSLLGNLEVKAQTIAKLQHENDNVLLLELLEPDLIGCKSAVWLSRQHTQSDRCPWIQVDVFALKVSASIMDNLNSNCELMVCTDIRPGISTRVSA